MSPKTDTHKILNRNSLVESGSVLELDFSPFPAIHRPAILAWAEMMPPSIHFAGWVDEKYVTDRRQLRWAYDGAKYTAAGLVEHIVFRALGPHHPLTVSGWHFLRTSAGVTLFALANELPKN